jgi:GntR family transcriptional regulator, vanillate catabolism transcriptional regulator
MTEQPRSPAGDATSQTDRVILTLREMLLRGDFRPGERLAELTLVPRLQASRTPVRLALDRLAHEGLLEALPSGGFRIREFAIADIWDAIEVRGVLDGTAARLAAERLTSPSELEKLRRCGREMERLYPLDASCLARYVEMDEVFQTELRRLANSRILVRAIEGIIGLTFAASGTFMFADDDTDGTSRTDVIAKEYHRVLIEAIEHRQGTRAESLAREYSRMARRNLVRAVQDKDLFRRLPGASLIRMPAAGQISR